MCADEEREKVSLRMRERGGSEGGKEREREGERTDRQTDKRKGDTEEKELGEK